MVAMFELQAYIRSKPGLEPPRDEDALGITQVPAYRLPRLRPELLQAIANIENDIEQATEEAMACDREELVRSKAGPRGPSIVDTLLLETNGASSRAAPHEPATNASAPPSLPVPSFATRLGAATGTS
jgi:hypothetical protein